MNTPAESASLVEQRAKQLQAGRAAATGMPREALQGYPVPVSRGGALYLAFPYMLRSGKPPAPPKITAPGWVGYIDVATGSDVQFVTLAAGPGEPLGEHKLPPTMDMATFQASQRKLYSLMTGLLDVAAAPNQPLDTGQRAAAKEFRMLWKSLAHKPIARFYRDLNPAWFDAVGIR